MSEHKSALVVVGNTAAGKTLTLAMAAMERYAVEDDKENVVVFVTDEEIPAQIAERLASISNHAGLNWAAHERDEMLDHFFYASPEEAVGLMNDFSDKHFHVFIDCVGQTSVSADHSGLKVSFHGVDQNHLELLASEGILQGVTVSNWGA